MRRPVLVMASMLALSVAAFAQTAPTPAGRPAFVTVTESAVLASSLQGLNVYNAGDENVGEISDVVLEKAGVNAFILSVGGFLGVGTHYVAVDPGALALTWDSTKKRWDARINATKDQLKAAPQFKYEGRFAK